MTDEIAAYIVRVTGRVQGVNFRAWTRGEAEALGLSGWVRNEADGAVTALIAGPRPAIEAMLARLRHGPGLASVTDIAAEPCAPPDSPGFRVLR